jgi:hypothetical protein
MPGFGLLSRLLLLAAPPALNVERPLCLEKRLKKTAMPADSFLRMPGTVGV